MEINKIMKELEDSNIFLTGAGGVGKSYSTEKVIQRYYGLNKNVVILGSTGIASSNIGGQTIHAFFKIGMCQTIKEYNLFIESLKPNVRMSVSKKLESIISFIDLLVIDEVSMVSAGLLNLIEHILYLYNFKGKILLVGDFYQLPPVKNDKYAFESDAWLNKIKPKPIILEKIYRTKNIEFVNVLNNIRVGNVNDNDIVCLEQLRLNKDKVKASFPTILTSTNKEALAYNKKYLDKINAPLHMYKWKLSVNNTGHDEIGRNYWKKKYNKKIFNFCRSLLCDENLEVKVGVTVLFISNSDRYYNGEKGRIIEIREKLYSGDSYTSDKERIEQSLVIEKLNGEIIELSRNKWELIEYERAGNEIQKNVIATVYQYPIKLGFSITIHKSQSLSIDNLICDINRIFEDSQFYVAISRAINPNNTYIHYKKNDFKEYIKSICTINKKVDEFYKNGC